MFNNTRDKLDKQNKEVGKKVNVMDKRVMDNKQSSDENKQKIDEIMKKIADIPATKGDHSKIEKTIQVMKDEDSRKANIIVYNTEESDADDIKQRTRDDVNFIFYFIYSLHQALGPYVNTST